MLINECQWANCSIVQIVKLQQFNNIVIFTKKIITLCECLLYFLPSTTITISPLIVLFLKYSMSSNKVPRFVSS